MLIDRLAWTECPDGTARTLFAQLTGAADEEQVASFDVKARAAALPFYRHWQLVRISSTYRETGDVMEDVYAVWREGREPLLLDGTNDSVFAANEDEEIRLEPATAADYVRYFCFAVRGTEGPFILFEEAPADPPPEAAAGAALARPITITNTAEDGTMLLDATMLFIGTAFNVVLSLPPDGAVEMTDEEPVAVEIPAEIIPSLPDLGIGPLLQGFLLRSVPGFAIAALPAAAGPPPTSRKPTIVEMVELLLDRALRGQSDNRLLGLFNATLPGASAIEQFAGLIMKASPVVIVETNIPFVEETISQIVKSIVEPASDLAVCTAVVPTDDSPIQFYLPTEGPALVLIPLQVYRGAAQVERLAFDIATRDLAAIITCERFEQLPESLRRHTDVVLRLPPIDVALFETLFGRVMGGPPPSTWQADGTDWVKHVLHTDFEHPRRMGLPVDEAIAFVRSQVTERLGSVDPGHGLRLSQLHGLGEARLFAEDLIADIHAAMSGSLPWSQVDRGALLVGPPGTGKTTLAKAIAKDCGVRFITASATGWMAEGGSLGPHIQAIRRTFSEARSYAPSILFIDEIDSLGNREAFAGDNNSVYQTEVVNAVLEQIQGLDPAAPVFVIGATNHEERVDPALRRSGRLDRVIRIPRPNSESLDQIFQHYIGALGTGMELAPDLDTHTMGGMSVGLTGADVERIVRGAARRARRAGRPLSQNDVIAEITNKPRGTEASLRLTPAELERTAIHEAGHALGLFLSASNGSDIGFVTIVPRDDGTLGFVAPLPDERVHLTRRDYEEKLEVFLAGRAAEEIRFGEDQVSSGASSDLESATELVSRMVTKLGMDGSRRLLWTESMSPDDRVLAETTLSQAYDRILEKLRAHEPRLQRLARALFDRQELPGDEVRTILAG